MIVKKALLVAACLAATLYLGGCAKGSGGSSVASGSGSLISLPPVSSDASSRAPAEESNDTSATDSQTDMTVAQAVDQIGKSVDITKKEYKISDMYGGVDAMSFTVNKVTYVLALYVDGQELEEAKSGSRLMFGGSMTMTTKVNGHFVLIYAQDKGEDAVAQAFQNLKE